MSSVQGGKVREPRIVGRPVLPSDKRSSSWKDLAQAWASLGEAKSVLQRLDELSPPNKKKPPSRPSLRNHTHRPTGTAVHFANGVGERRSRGHSHASTHKPAEALQKSKVPNFRWEKEVGAGALTSHAGSRLSPPFEPRSGYSTEDSEKENVVEGSVLNCTTDQPLRLERRNERGGDHPDPVTAPKTSPTPAGLPTVHASSGHPLTLPSTVSHQYSPASNPNVIAFSPSRPHLTHTNTRAVFGPSVSFGDLHHSPPPGQYGNVTTRGTARIEVEPRRPLTRKTFTSAPPPSSSIPPPLSSGVSRPAIRKFELPAETLDSLRSRVEQQRLAVEATASRVGVPKPRTTAFQPPPGATTSLASTSTSRGPPLPSELAPPSGRPHHTHGRRTEEGVTKRRKVASVPPPPTYTGFSSVNLRVDGESLHWRPNLEKAGRPLAGPPPKPVFGDAVSAGTTKPPLNVGPERVRKVRRVVAISTTEGRPPNMATRKPESGLITPSSWRAGRELADRILRQEGHGTPAAATGTSSDEALSISDLRDEEETDRSETPVELAAKEEPTTNGTGLSHAARILEDLRMSPVDDHVSDHGPKRSVSAPASSAPKKPRYNFEPVYPTQRVRHYDQGKVQQYMLHKREERKRKEMEEREAQDKAQKEREERLQTLYSHQRRKLEASLRHQQKQRETYSQALASAPLHVHIHDTASSEREVPMEEHQAELLTVTPSHSHPLTSPRVSSTGGLAPGSLSTSSTHSSPRQRTQFPSPPHVLRVPDRSPPRYGSLQPPHTVSTDLPHIPSPAARGVVESHSPIPSPHTYSVHHSPPMLAPSPRRELVPSPPTHPPPAHTHVSPGRATRLRPSSSPPPLAGDLASLLRASQGENRSREERIQALTRSALRLKERIAMESRRLTEPSQSFEETARPSSSPPELRARSTYDHAPHDPPTPSVSLPGVQSVHQHALQAERARREAEAAMKIQGAYRGYQVRRSLRWELPSGGTLGGGRAGDGAETESERGGVQSDEEVEEVIELEPSTAVSEPQRVSPPFPGSQSCPALPVSAPPPPWEQTGGDVNSVINIFARQHERLREKLAEMKTQKLAELQEIQEQASSIRPSSAEQPEPSETGRRSQGPVSQSYSYSQTFEEPSREERDEAGSQVSEPFSEDSLVPPASQSSPPQVTSHSVPPPSHDKTLTETGSLGPSVITPPGSPSFVDTYSDDTHLEPTEPKAEQPHPSRPRTQDGRLSPRSLEVKLHAELNLLESVEESMRQLSALENTRAVSLAQQESVTLAQVLKSRQVSHEHELDLLASKARREVEEASTQFKRVHDEAVLASEQVRRLREEADTRSREQASQLAKLHEESVVAAQEATRQLLEARTNATSAVIGAAQQQLQAAHDVAVSAASAAAKQAVRSALKVVGHAATADGSEFSTVTSQDASRRTLHDGPSPSASAVPTYQSDFEPSTMQPDSLAEEEEEDKDVSTDLESQSTPKADHSGDRNSSIEESLTPVVSDAHLSAEGDGALVEGEGQRGRGTPPPPRTPSPEEEIEESIDEEASFRELLPSESHRRRRIHYHHSTDSESRCSTPSRPQTPTAVRVREDVSPASTEDTFFRFMDKMVRQYMREEELRARHQANLLELREKAVQEKTQAELEWVRLKKKQIRSKGEDDLMPPLVQREKGLLMRLQEEQAEIRHLHEVQRNASHERKLMFMQQREISKIRRSAQYYRQKIHRYRSQEGSGREDHLSTSDREISPAPSVEGSWRYSLDHSISEDLSKTREQEEVKEIEHATPVAATQTPTLPTSSPTTLSPHPSPEEPQSSSLCKLKDRRSDDTLNTPATDSTTVRRLQEIASGRDVERQLAGREKRLARRRHVAETALKKQRELSVKERQLDREEEQVNKLISTLEGYEKDKLGGSKGRSGHTRSKRAAEKTQTASPESASVSHSASARSPPPPWSVTELQSSESVPEEIPSEDGKEPTQTEVSPASHPPTVPTTVPTEYGSDTFESLETTLTHPPSHPHVMSSTPVQPSGLGHDTPSPSESLKITSSVSESVGTATSDGSMLEARIRQLKDQLRARKEEARRIQSEQRRKKKNLLRQQEDELKRKLEAVETVISTAKRVSPSPPPPLEIFSLSSSSVATSQTGSPGMSSEEGDRTPHPISPPYQVSSRDAVDTTLEPNRPVSSSKETETESVKPLPSPHPLPDQQPASEVPTQLSDSHPPMGQKFSYTEFSESLPSARDGRGTDASITEAAKSVSEALEHMVESMRSAPHEAEPRSPTPEALVKLERVSPTSSLSEDVPAEEEQEDLVKGVEGGGEDLVRKEEEDGEKQEELRERAEPMEKEREGKDVPQPPMEGSYSETFEAPSESIAPTEEVPPSAGQIHDYLTPPSSVQNDADLSIGQRVLIGNVMAGTVRFVGHTHFAEGLWIGVELDMPKGRNDGSLDEHRYFHCEPNHGLFAPPGKVSLFDEEGEEEGEREVGEVYEEGSVAEEIESSYSSSHDGRAPSEGGGKLWEDKTEKQTPQASPVYDSYIEDFESEHGQPSTERESLLPGLQEPAWKYEEKDQEGNVGELDKELVEEVSEELSEPESSAAEEGLGWGEQLDTTPPPPPEFAERTPPRDAPLRLSPAKDGVVPPHVPVHRPAVNTIANELVQELSNEAYETMHHLWQSKKTVIPRNKEVPLSLEDKADRMADELLAMLLQSDTNLVCNIHSAKKSLECHSPPPKMIPKPHLPLTISIPLTPIIECSPPPLSPPSPYRTSPPPADHSPPGSPPRHLSQVTQARVAAGEKSPFPSNHHDPGTPTVPRNASAVLERSVSVESISRLLESIKLTTAQCMVPSERQQVNRVVKYAWNAAKDRGRDHLLAAELDCPQEVLSLFSDQRECSQDEQHCRMSYLRLVYDLSMEVIRDLQSTSSPTQSRCGSSGSQRRNREEVTMEVVQRKVYAALMRGQLPPQLPSVKFLYRMKRPGGREIDFVDAILIKELREEEPSWVEYGEDEEQVKLRAADAILDQLLSEAVQILCKIDRKRSKS